MRWVRENSSNIPQYLLYGLGSEKLLLEVKMEKKMVLGSQNAWGLRSFEVTDGKLTIKGLEINGHIREELTEKGGRHE